MSVVHADAESAQVVWPLRRRDLLTLQLQPGERLRCHRGTVWCTVDGAFEDVVLEAGDVYEAPVRQRLYVSGLAARDGCVSTSAPAAPSSTNSTRL